MSGGFDLHRIVQLMRRTAHRVRSDWRPVNFKEVKDGVTRE